MPPYRHILATTALVLLSACSKDEGFSSAQKTQAEALYKSNCAACHDNGASGAPTREALQSRTPSAIVEALSTGLMREQGKALSADERQLLGTYLGAREQKLAGIECKGDLRLSGSTVWNRWGNGVENRRYQPGSASGITPANLGSLKLKWAFAFPDASRARSQPAVTREAIFTGSQDGRVYALDLASGCTWWTFDAESEVRSAPTLEIGADGKVARIFFGDFNSNLYALDAATGRLLWKSKLRDHPAGTMTGSPTLFEGRLYVPMSSTEVVSAMEGEYACCTFRGGVAAVDAADGKLLWRFHTVPAPTVRGKNSKGADQFGPSGAPVWSTPTIDAKRRLVYFGTGENYSSPASEMSDAIIALDLATGKLRWVRQFISGDAWNASCIKSGNRINCPKEDGPDLDFGAPPMLVKGSDGRDIIVAGQKSGMIYALDPDRGGATLWSQRAGAGGFNGGIHWGMATDGKTVFAGIADTPGGAAPVGPRRPGVHAFDLGTGRPLWSRIEPSTCTKASYECAAAVSAPVTLTDGILFAGMHNGLLRAYAPDDGKPLWTFDTRREFKTVNGVTGRGGTIDSAGPVAVGGYLVVNSGYDKFGEIPGNMLLVFGL